jgi:serine/threonine protein phosphatase 1
MRVVDRVLAISDIHGESRSLLALLKVCDYDPNNDLLVIVGDMLDRGRENLETLAICQKLQQQGAIVLKGNHERFAQDSIVEMLTTENWRTQPSEDLYNWYMYHGGYSTFQEIKNLPPEGLEHILQFIRSLPFYYTTGRYIFAHAGADTTKSIENNEENDTIWMDESFPFCPAYHDKMLIFGHVPTWNLSPYNPKFNKRKQAKIWYDKVYKDKIGIDCGSCFGGRLAALEIPTYREFYV